MDLTVTTTESVVRAKLLNSISFIFSGLLALIILCTLTVVVFGQTLDQTYSSTECGLSIQYPSNWKIEEVNDEVGVINYIVEMQPDTDEGFRNVVRIELDDISTLPDKSFQGVKEFEEESLSTLGDLSKIITSQTAHVDGNTVQKIVYTEGSEGTPENDRFKKMKVIIAAFDKEYVITYDARNADYYDKYISTFEQMLKTFKISQSKFDGINCQPNVSDISRDGSNKSSLNTVLDGAKKSLNSQESGSKNATTSGFNTYESKKYGIKIQYPKDWDYFQESGSVDYSPNRLFVATFSSPSNKEALDTVFASFQVEKLKDATTREQLIKNFYDDNNFSTRHDVKDLVQSAVKLSGVPAFKIEYLSGDGQKYIHTEAITHNRLYSLTFSGEPDTLNKHVITIHRMTETAEILS
jgi:hypothetical protein